jgi:hypothetical protein
MVAIVANDRHVTCLRLNTQSTVNLREAKPALELHSINEDGFALSPDSFQ